jgi:hypothetical protein
LIGSEWGSNFSRKFYNAYPGQTDYGACCLIVPFLNLINPATRDIDPTDMSNSWFTISRHFVSQKKIKSQVQEPILRS